MKKLLSVMKKIDQENQILIKQESIAQILKQYSISDFTFKLITEGIANTSFVIESNENKYVLRVYAQNKRTNEDILFEVSFQDYLRSHDIPIPIIYSNKEDKELTVTEIDGRHWQSILMKFVDGKSINEHPSSVLILKLAQIQAKMHLLGEVFTEESNKSKKLWSDLQDSLAAKLESVPVKQEAISAFIERVKHYNYKLNPELPHGYNHLDIDFDGNVITCDDAVSAIIDFEDVEYSPMVVCLGYSLWNILDDRGIDAMHLYLREYEKIRPLNSIEREVLPHVIFFRNYVIGIVRLMLWEEDTPIEDITSLIELEKNIPTLNLIR